VAVALRAALSRVSQISATHHEVWVKLEALVNLEVWVKALLPVLERVGSNPKLCRPTLDQPRTSGLLLCMQPLHPLLHIDTVTRCLSYSDPGSTAADQTPQMHLFQLFQGPIHVHGHVVRREGSRRESAGAGTAQACRLMPIGPCCAPRLASNQLQ